MRIISIPVQTTATSLPDPGNSALDFRPAEASPLAQAPGNEERAKAVLKRAYLECRKDVKSRAETLRQAIVGLLGIGIPWQQLVRWAKSASSNDRYARKLTSQIFLDLGIRQREPGAGPKLPKEAFDIERDIRDQYGHLTYKFLRAACQVAKARDEGDSSAGVSPAHPSESNPYSDRG